jgi:hypothetical protein
MSFEKKVSNLIHALKIVKDKICRLMVFNLFFVAPMGIDSADIEIFKGSMVALRPA